MNRQRLALVALLLIFLTAHLALLPRTLEDLDSVNFALGVRSFDIAKHQPHPPGYPVFIALGKVSTAVLRRTHVDAPATRGLAVWSAIAGTAALPALLLFFRRLEGRDDLAGWATLLVAGAPLFWFSALRPLSDMLGFAAAMWSLALAVSPAPKRRLVLALLFAGLAIGVRSQTAVLTIPTLLVARWRTVDARVRIGAAAAFAVGALLWAIPMIVATGGLASYLRALGGQAGEDFSGVTMLWTHHHVRDIAAAVANTFVWPWDWWLGLLVSALAAIGALRILWRAPSAAAALAVAFAPYLLFHLLFQETMTTRYALPMVPVVAYAALAALEGLPGRVMPVAAVGLAAAGLLLAVPASIIYARDGAPVFRAFDDMAASAQAGDRVDAIGMHAEMRRASEWADPILPAPVLRARHGEEWRTLVDLWRRTPAARVWFAADPDRTDLALFDPHARQLARAYRWGFVEPPFVGGARPDNVDWYRMQPPGWMLDRGWAITPEVGGVTERDSQGPAIAPAIAWLRSTPAPLTIILGGRNISSAPATLAVALNGPVVESFVIQPGFFVERWTAAAGSVGGAPYVPLSVRAGVAAGGQVSLEQFDAEPPGVPMRAFGPGWQEPEYNPATAKSWRWAADRSELWVRPIGRPVIVRLNGESPLRYFKTAPHVTVTVAGQTVATFDPTADFDQEIAIPDALLAQAGGRVVVTSSALFHAKNDPRALALRLFSVTVK